MFISSPAQALEANKSIADFIHETWSVDDGLPQSTIRSMAQTRDGYMWFATHEGVARFDGRHFTVFNAANSPALRGSGIAALREARDGSLYLGLRDGGLVRYQNEKFEAVKPTGGLPKGSVSVLEEDANGTLWIGTSGGGLAKLSVASNKSQIFSTAQGLPHDIVTSIRPTVSGDVWIGTFGGLSLIRKSVGEGALVPKPITEPGGEKLNTIYIASILEDRRGRLWIATYGNGLYRRDVQKNAQQNAQKNAQVGAQDASRTTALNPSAAPQKFHVFSRKHGLASDNLTRVFEDRAGNIWLGTLEGLQKLSATATTITVAQADSINDDRNEFETYSSLNGLSNNFVRDILEDAEGSLWIGTDRGIDRFREGLFTTWGAQRGLAEEFTRTVIEDKTGAIWVGTGDGLFKFTGAGVDAKDTKMSSSNVRRYGKKDGLLNNAVLSLAEGQDGVIWVGTNAGGLHRLSRDRFENVGVKMGLEASSVRSILATKDGALWLAANTGLYRAAMEGSQERPTKRYRATDGLPGDQVISLHEDRANVLWIGTREGLATFKNGIIAKHPDLGSSGPILSIIAAHHNHGSAVDNNLVVTTGNGFAVIAGNKTHFFQSAQGVPSQAFLSAVDDRKGFLWLCSNQGIVKIANAEITDIINQKRDRLTTETFGRSDGMATVQCNGGSAPASWRTHDGRLLFATARGLAVVDAGRERKINTRAPPVHITGINIDTEAVPITERLELKPGKHRLDISYVGLSLADPVKVRYRYQLVGFDPTWIEAGGERRAVYTNLAPGQYEFRVTASNNDGVWNTKPASVGIEYLPQFYERPLFRWGFALLLVAVGFLAYFARIRILRLQAESLQRIVDDRTRDLAVEKEKLERTNEEKAQLLVQVKQQSEAYEKLSKEDSLTSLANRRELTRFLSNEFERAWRNQRPLCVVLADLDEFKAINDQFSHAVGDDVLRVVARILSEGCRAIDMVARYGGEEFAIVLPETEIEAARGLCERLRNDVAQYNWETIRPKLAVTMSFGIASNLPKNAEPAMDHDKLLDAADEQLYGAKWAGRNRVSG